MWNWFEGAVVLLVVVFMGHLLHCWFDQKKQVETVPSGMRKR
jgi:hypothetical protein